MLGIMYYHTQRFQNWRPIRTDLYSELAYSAARYRHKVGLARWVTDPLRTRRAEKIPDEF